MIEEDPILTEIRQTRENLLSQFDNLLVEKVNVS